MTIGDFFLPMPKGMQHVTVQWERKKTSIGTYMPSTTVIQLGSPKEKAKHVYQFTSDNYAFDSFDKKTIYPIADLTAYGMQKKYTNAD